VFTPSHTEIKGELERKFEKYTAVKREHLAKTCLFLTEEKIFEAVFFEYLHLSSRQPLWKLKKDLFEEIKKLKF